MSEYRMAVGGDRGSMRVKDSERLIEDRGIPAGDSRPRLLAPDVPCVGLVMPVEREWQKARGGALVYLILI